MTALVEVQRVAVIGAGTMGTGIAQVAARAGYRTEIYDAVDRAARRSIDRIGESLSRAVEKGKCTQEEREATLSRLSIAPDLETAASGADLVIEAAPEDLALKLDLFGRLSKAARSDAILASNTSSLPVTAIAAATSHPGRVVGLHFFNPVPVMKLLEIVQGELPEWRRGAPPRSVWWAPLPRHRRASRQGGRGRPRRPRLRHEPPRHRSSPRGHAHGRGGSRLGRGDRPRHRARLRAPDGAAQADGPRRPRRPPRHRRAPPLGAWRALPATADPPADGPRRKARQEERRGILQVLERSDH